MNHDYADFEDHDDDAERWELDAIHRDEQEDFEDDDEAANRCALDVLPSEQKEEL